LVTLLVETPLDARQLTWLLALSCCVRGWIWSPPLRKVQNPNSSL